MSEPVAWRWKAMVNNDFVSSAVLTHSEPPPYAFEIEPLYLHPAPDHREVMRQALEALEQDNPLGRSGTIAALRAALGEADDTR